MKYPNWLKKLKEWEYWPFHWVYGPVYPVFIWYMVRSGFRFFFSAANPTIENGGFLMESKKKVYDLLPAGTYPLTLYFEPGIAPKTVLEESLAAGLVFPLVIKPDIGGRGRGVVIAANEAEFLYYLPLYTLPFLVQDFVPFEKEAGIFFVKHPGTGEGRVTGIVGKSFGSVTGNGISTLSQLVKQDDRLGKYAASLLPQLGGRVHEILPEGKTEILVQFGNHARGATFYNWSNLIDEKVHNWACRLAAGIEGFYFGRLDIRFSDWDEMIDEDKFSIIELNGAGSEATHIYDPSQSLFFAWKEIIRHWKMLWLVSRANRKMGARYMSFREARKMFRASNEYDALLDEMHNRLLKKPDPSELMHLQ